MVTSISKPNVTEIFSLEDYLKNPPERMEWIDGTLVEKNGMTLKHGRIQLALGAAWNEYQNSTAQGGTVYTDAPCRTTKQGRRPDVAYLIPDLLAQFGDADVLPQSFPLCAEIVSPTDEADAIFSKANEYLESGCYEVWLVFPNSGWIVILTHKNRVLFTRGEVAKTQVVLPGFSISVDALLGLL